MTLATFLTSKCTANLKWFACFFMCTFMSHDIAAIPCYSMLNLRGNVIVGEFLFVTTFRNCARVIVHESSLAAKKYKIAKMCCPKSIIKVTRVKAQNEIRAV